MNCLALDLGKRRTGVAVAQGHLITALPTLLTDRPGFESALEQLIAEFKVTEIVLGWPSSEDGSQNQQTAWVQSWLDRPLFQGLTVHLTNEYLTSFEAKRQIKEGLAPGYHDIDQLSAVLILEQFLNE